MKRTNYLVILIALFALITIAADSNLGEQNWTHFVRIGAYGLRSDNADKIVRNAQESNETGEKRGLTETSCLVTVFLSGCSDPRPVRFPSVVVTAFAHFVHPAWACGLGGRCARKRTSRFTF